MNKAFVREPDQTGEFCPECGSLGEPVTAVTLDAQLTPEARRGIADLACFCPYPRCDVVYFDSFERVVTTAALSQGVYPKDSSAPLCACFGFTREEVEQDVAEGVLTRVKALFARSKSPEANCAIKAANGKCCSAEVQRYYYKCLGSKS
jgi:CopZ-like zinc binding protein